MYLFFALFVIGILLLVGPQALKLFLLGASYLVPNALSTTTYLMTLLIVLFVLGLLTRHIRAESRNEKTSGILGKISTIIYSFVGASIALFFLNPVIVSFKDYWVMLTDNNPETFEKIAILGLIFIFLSVGFFTGVKYTQKRVPSNIQLNKEKYDAIEK